MKEIRVVLNGKIVHGKKYGRKIGYPTANIDGRADLMTRREIRAGVYAGLITFEKSRKIYKAAIVVQPIVGRRRFQIEAYLFNFRGNLYGKRLKFEFKNYIRPYKKFNGRKELIPQIKKDIRKIEQFLA